MRQATEDNAMSTSIHSYRFVAVTAALLLAATASPDATSATRTSVNSSASVNRSASVNSSANVNRSASVNSSANVNRSASVNSSANVNRSATVNSSATVNRSANVNSNVNVNRNVNVNSNVNVNRNVNVNVDNHWDDNYYHPVARGVAVGTAIAVTAVAIGSIAYSIPPSCMPVYVNGLTYQQCGSTWYTPQYAGSSVQYIVVVAPR
jgi:hypothetical protein